MSGLTHSRVEEWDDSTFTARPPWEKAAASSKEPSGEEFRTPKYHRGARKPRTLASPGSHGEEHRLPRRDNFDLLKGGDPVSARRQQFYVQEPSPITGAQFFTWQQLADEQTDGNTATCTSEVASFAVASIQETGATNPETRASPKPRRKRGKKHRSGVVPDDEAESQLLSRKVRQLVTAVARGSPDTERLVLEAYDLTSEKEEVVRPIAERMLLSLIQIRTTRWICRPWGPPSMQRITATALKNAPSSLAAPTSAAGGVKSLTG